MNMKMTGSENMSKVFEIVENPRARLEIESDAGFAQLR